LGFERYSVLASAIAFRRLEVRSTEGGSTYTDGQTVFVDASTDAGDLRDAVSVQAALLAGGSLEKDVITRLSRHRRTTADRYLTLELRRVVHLLDQVLPARTIRRIKSLGIEPLSSSNLESLEHALGREAITQAPDWAGTILPRRPTET
jgi:nitric oxide reductase NorD protein